MADQVFNDRTSNKPIIEFSDNSIYTPGLSYSIIGPLNNLDHDLILNDLSANDITSDASAIIQYFAVDLVGLSSEPITLNLNFKNIPFLDLLGYAKEVVQVYDSSYTDKGIIIDDISFGQGLSFTKPSNNDISGNTLFPSINYDISYSTDISLNKIGIYEIIYDVKISDQNDINTIKRIIEVVDTTKPFFLFSGISGEIDASNGLPNHTTALLGSPDISYSIDNSYIHNFDFSLTYQSSFTDLSRIIHDFDVSDNYFLDLSKKITLTISGEKSEFLDSTILDISYLTDGSFSAVTIGTYALPKLEFEYTVTDACNKSFSFTRNVDIIDITVPTISFNNILTYTDYSYVYFDQNLKDFSYQAFNYDVSSSRFIQEISDILFGFDICDNLTTDQTNFYITVSNEGYDFSFNTPDELISEFSNNSNQIKELFSKIDTSFVVQYDFSDNQDNSSTIFRTVNIINTIEPSLNLVNESPHNPLIQIDFGNYTYDILTDFSLTHPRLNNTDLSFDLSYILPYNVLNKGITTISGEYKFDASALIYSDPERYDISFYNVSTFSGEDLSSEILLVKVDICNSGPDITLPDSSFEHIAGTPISDASFIIGIHVDSSYDTFFYRNDISYTGTDFSLIIQPNLNQENPLPGSYTITYSAIDQNDVLTSISRELIVIDQVDPIITLYGLTVETIFTDTSYIDPGAYFEDLHNDLSIIEITIEKNGQDPSSITIPNINSKVYDYSNNYYPAINTDISGEYTITYTATDVSDNSYDISRTINIVGQQGFIFTPKIDICGILFELNENFNSELSNNLIDIDLSYDNVNKIITYEATLTFENITFDLSATYGSNEIGQNNITVIHSIVSNVVGNYPIYFQAFTADDFKVNTEIINFQVIDTTAPVLTFVNSSDFLNIDLLVLPLLSSTSKAQLLSKITYFNNANRENPNLFVKDDSNDIFFSVPGIEISDIVSGSIISLSNETLEQDKFNLTVTYQEISGIYPGIYPIDWSDVSNSYLPTISGYYIQNYNVIDENSNETDISRIIQVKKALPFINLNYDKDDNYNLYRKHYLEQFYTYNEQNGKAFDYYDGDLSLVVDYLSFTENVLGEQNIKYITTNQDGSFYEIMRDIHVVNINTLPNNIFINEIINDASTNTKYGLYNEEYTIVIDSSKNAIRINSAYDYDISNLINITDGSNVSYNDISYYWGNVTLNVSNNFNRASIEYLNDGSSSILEDVFLYNERFKKTIVTDIFEEVAIINKNLFTVDVSGQNSSTGQYFTIEDYTREIIKQKTLYLPIGIYKFDQKSFKNFYCPIKFSHIEDGFHNPKYSFNNINDVSFQKYNYTKNVKFHKLPGFSGSNTEIIIDATTPSPLYYYSEKFPNMGGRIELTNNIIFHKNDIALNGNVLTIDNSNSLNKYISDYGYDISFLQNRIFLSQHFSSEEGEKKHFIGLTHQNINHNILVTNQESNKNKIIFKKYQDLSDNNPINISNSIKHDISNNYLLDFGIDNPNTNTLTFFYNFIIDSSAELLNTNNTNNNNYELDAKNIFYNNDELENYASFFNRNKILDKSLYENNFLYKINELAYINNVELIDAGSNYKFYLNNYLSSSRIIFDSMLDNKITFNFQIYLNTDTLSFEENYLNYLKTSVFNKNINNLTNPNYPLDLSNLFFGEYIVNIFSDISGQYSVAKDTTKQSIIFSPNTIEFNEFLLDSSGTNELLYKLYNVSMTNPSEIASANTILKDRIFLSLNDSNENRFIGLTQQNMYHNMFINENNNIIFHKYDPSSNICQVNDPNLTLEKTNTEATNSKKYLLEISTNDVYNCFTDSSKNIYENAYSKNSNIVAGYAGNYRTRISYDIKDELQNANTYLTEFDIRQINGENDLHSHSYIINLSDHIDRDFYNTEKMKEKMPYNNINYDNLYFVINDISYTRDFNLYDVYSLQNIIYKKEQINILKYLESFIHITNLKLDYLYKIIGASYKKDTLGALNYYNYNPSNYTFINDLDMQNISTLYEDTGYISTIHGITLSNKSLNQLFSNTFYNSKILIEKYTAFFTIADFFHNIIDFNNNIYESIRDFDAVDQLLTDISLINLNVDNLALNQLFKGIPEATINFMINFSLNEYSDFNILKDLLLQFNTWKENYDILVYELKLRHNLEINSSFQDISYTNLYNIYDTDNFYKELIQNYIKLNQILINDISETNLFIEPDNISDKSFDDISSNYSENVQYLYNQSIHIENNFNNLINSIDELYNFINKERIFDKINYVLNGKEILINSFKSNNIVIKFDMYYNSYLYPNFYLDTFVLDMVSPDYTPPTLIFNSTDLSFSQSLSTENNIDTLVQILIDDISYIDINQEYNDISLQDIDYQYIDISTNEISDIKYPYSLIYIDISQVYNIETFIDDKATCIIKYIVKDNANNTNIIERLVTVYTEFIAPVFYYYALTVDDYISQNSENSFDINIEKGSFITDAIIRANISAKDPNYDNNRIDVSYAYIPSNFDNTVGISVDISIVYTATSEKGTATTLYRNVMTDAEVVIEEKQIHCCYPKVYYKPIQHSYKMGSANSSAMRLAKIIMNQHKF